MGIKEILIKILENVKKYKYALLVLVIGFLLLAVPGRGEKEEIDAVRETGNSHTETSLEEKLTQILSKVDGAGKVQVMLSIASGEEVVYQTNDDKTSDNDSTSSNIDTVIITDPNRNQNGLVRQVKSAVYQGALVVCQGADNPSVHLMIVDAVTKLTGLGANHISVLKMK